MLRKYFFIKGLLLLFAVSVMNPAIAENPNARIIKKNINQGYITISADNLADITKKVNKGGKFSVNNKKNISSAVLTGQRKKEKKKKVEVIRINSPADAPVRVNKTEQFVFRDITQRSNNGLSDGELSSRTAKIDFLRKQLKSR